jgi:hypothetical protein
MKERSGNVYENKGPVWKKWERSTNVYENKVVRFIKAGMLLKIKVVIGKAVGRGWAKIASDI